MIRRASALLTQPSRHIHDASLARRLQIMAGGLTVVLGLGAPMALAVLVFWPDQFRGSPAATGALIGTLALLYLGLRSRWGLQALWSFALGGTAIVWLVLGTAANIGDLAAGLALGFLPFAVAALIPTRAALVLVFPITVGGIVWCAFQVPGMTLSLSGPTIVMFLLSTIVLGALQWVGEVDRREAVNALVAERDATRRAAQAEDARSRMMLAAHHELRTPLNGILGVTSLLLEEELPEHTAALVGAAQVSAERLQALVEDLLVFVDEQQGGLKISEDEVDLADIARRVALDLAGAATARGVELEVLTNEARARTDRQRIEQITRHLISNAVRFTEEGRIQVCTREEDEHVALVVSDTGRGMTPAELELALTPFRQLSEGTTRSVDGLGIGLATTRVLARALGGELRIESTPGDGTVATVAIPRRAA